MGDGNICYTNGPSTSALKNCCSVKTGVICKEHDLIIIYIIYHSNVRNYLFFCVPLSRLLGPYLIRDNNLQ